MTDGDVEICGTYGKARGVNNIDLRIGCSTCVVLLYYFYKKDVYTIYIYMYVNVLCIDIIIVIFGICTYQIIISLGNLLYDHGKK